MFGPILLALGGLLISIAFCYPTDSDDQVRIDVYNMPL